MFGTFGSSVGLGTGRGLPSSSSTAKSDAQKMNWSAPSGIGIPTRSRNSTQKSVPLCSPISCRAYSWDAKVVWITPSTSTAKPLAMPNCSAMAFDGNFRM